MNYQNYFPASYQPMYAQPTYQPPIQTPVPQIQQQQQQQQPQSTMPVVWVQGEAGAKSFLLAPNQRAMLMDSESDTFFIKSTDASGMPLPLRIFDYTERTQQPHTDPQIQQNSQAPEYITREEFEKRLSEILESKRSNSTTKKEKAE